MKNVVIFAIAVLGLHTGCSRCASAPRPIIQTAYAECERSEHQPSLDSACDPGRVQFTCVNYMVGYYASPPPGQPPQCFEIVVERWYAEEFQALHLVNPHVFSNALAPHVYCAGR